MVIVRFLPVCAIAHSNNHIFGACDFCDSDARYPAWIQLYQWIALNTHCEINVATSIPGSILENQSLSYECFAVYFVERKYFTYNSIPPCMRTVSITSLARVTFAIPMQGILREPWIQLYQWIALNVKSIQSSLATRIGRIATDEVYSKKLRV